MMKDACLAKSGKDSWRRERFTRLMGGVRRMLGPIVSVRFGGLLVWSGRCVRIWIIISGGRVVRDMVISRLRLMQNARR